MDIIPEREFHPPPDLLDEGENENENENDNTWRSACLECDKDFVVFMCTYLMILMVTLFCFYQLIHLPNCSDQSSYLGVLGLILGIFVPSPSMKK